MVVPLSYHLLENPPPPPPACPCPRPKKERNILSHKGKIGIACFSSFLGKYKGYIRGPF